jgi:hypothetical protein
MVRFLVRELGAYVDQSPEASPLLQLHAIVNCDVEMLRCLVRELGANVNYAAHDDGDTALPVAVGMGDLDMVRFLVKELGADVNQARHGGVMPLMAANGIEMARWLLKKGANAQASAQSKSAAVMSRDLGSPAEQLSYLEARAHCTNPGCSGMGTKKCAGCLEVYYCHAVGRASLPTGRRTRPTHGGRSSRRKRKFEAIVAVSV